MNGYTQDQQVGHVHQNWTEIWGPDDAEGTHEVLGSAMGESRDANATLWASSPILLAELKRAVHLIRLWHGEVGWDLYYQMSPEMNAIRQAIGRAEATDYDMNSDARNEEGYIKFG
jgi:hypothetical protein